jgi:hypothetical protein
VDGEAPADGALPNPRPAPGGVPAPDTVPVPMPSPMQTSTPAADTLGLTPAPSGNLTGATRAWPGDAPAGVMPQAADGAATQFFQPTGSLTVTSPGRTPGRPNTTSRPTMPAASSTPRYPDNSIPMVMPGVPVSNGQTLTP